MFDLENHVADWRRAMLASGIETPALLEELENHLRDDILRQTKSGGSEAEAFRIAVHNLGPAPAVKSEFAKIEEAEEAHRWREGQALSAVILGLLQLLLIGAVLFNSEMSAAQRMSSLAAIATSILLSILGRWSCQAWPVIRAQRDRLAVVTLVGGVPAVLWILIFAQSFLAGHEFPFGQWLTTSFWVCCPPLGAFLGLILGFETAARKRIA